MKVKVTTPVATGIMLVFFGMSVHAAPSWIKCGEKRLPYKEKLFQKAFDTVMTTAVPELGKGAIRAGQYWNEVVRAKPGGEKWFLKHFDKIYDATKFVESIAAGDTQSTKRMVKDKVMDVAIVSGITKLGVPMAGQIYTAWQIVQISEEAIHHEEYLYQFDVMRWRFWENRKFLKMKKGKQIDHFVNQILARNPEFAKVLNGYIDLELPEHEKAGLYVPQKGLLYPLEFPGWAMKAKHDRRLRRTISTLLNDMGLYRSREIMKRLERDPAFKRVKDVSALLRIRFGSADGFRRKVCDEYRRLLKNRILKLGALTKDDCPPPPEPNLYLFEADVEHDAEVNVDCLECRYGLFNGEKSRRYGEEQRPWVASIFGWTDANLFAFDSIEKAREMFTEAKPKLREQIEEEIRKQREDPGGGPPLEVKWDESDPDALIGECIDSSVADRKLYMKVGWFRYENCFFIIATHKDRDQDWVRRVFDKLKRDLEALVDRKGHEGRPPA